MSARISAASKSWIYPKSLLDANMKIHIMPGMNKLDTAKRDEALPAFAYDMHANWTIVLTYWSRVSRQARN